MKTEITGEQVDEIAKGIYDGTIFTNSHLPNPNNAALQSLVFVGLTFEDKDSIRDREDHTLIYQYLEKSIGRTHEIDGKQYPTFLTYETCNRADHERVIEAYKVLKKQSQ